MTKKFRTENNKVFRELIHILIQNVILPIKHTQHLAQCIGNHRKPIGYGRSEAKDELKLVDNKCTRSTSQHKTEQTQVWVFVAFL